MEWRLDSCPQKEKENGSNFSDVGAGDSADCTSHRLPRRRLLSSTGSRVLRFIYFISCKTVFFCGECSWVFDHVECGWYKAYTVSLLRQSSCPPPPHQGCHLPAPSLSLPHPARKQAQGQGTRTPHRDQLPRVPRSPCAPTRTGVLHSTQYTAFLVGSR